MRKPAAIVGLALSAICLVTNAVYGAPPQAEPALPDATELGAVVGEVFINAVPNSMCCRCAAATRC